MFNPLQHLELFFLLGLAALVPLLFLWCWLKPLVFRGEVTVFELRDAPTA
jgi:hypothetical protein